MDNIKDSLELSMPVRWSVRRILVLGVPLLALVLGIAFFSRGHRETGPVVQPAIVQPAPIPIDYKKLVAEKVTEASRQNDLAVLRFRKGLKKALASYTAGSEIAASKTAEKLSSADDLANILFYLAKDKTNSGHQTDNYLDSETQPILNPLLQKLGRNTNVLIQGLDDELRRISMQLAVDLASIGPGKPEVPGHVVLTLDVKREFDAIVKRLGFDVTVLSVTVIFSNQIGAATSRAIPKRVAVIAASMFAKQVAKIAASSAIGSIPSPIPFPQLIALAGFAWTAYEIRAISDDFRDEIHNLTTIGLGRVGATTNTYAHNFAIKQTNAFRNIQTAMGSESLKAILGKEERL
jgi:hypothetical protein